MPQTNDMHPLEEQIEQELRSLEAAFKRNSKKPLSVPTQLDSVPTHLDREVVWEIPSSSNVLYMSTRHESTTYPYITYVDTENFYYHWLRSRLSSLDGHCVPRSQMPDDDKYQYAIEGFADGRSNPVPLAIVNAKNWEGTPHISFTDGITRTFFLIAHRVETFPVCTASVESAKNLFNWVGIGEKFFELQELTC